GGDDGEPASRLSRPGRLDAGVERQQVGLERNLVDHANDLADFPRGLGDCAHRVDRLTHDDGALLGVVVGGGHHTCWAWLVPSADCFTVVVTSPSVAVVCSRLTACCSVRRERSSEAEDISCAPVRIASALSTTDTTVVLRRSIASLKSSRICA